MTALVQAFSRLSATTNIETETLKVIAAFCCAGLAASVLCATCGLDLSRAFSDRRRRRAIALRLFNPERCARIGSAAGFLCPG
jgi:hypothetical protein